MNIKLELQFSEEEIIEFLKKKGYSIKEIQTSITYPTYHNSLVTDYHTRKLAYIDVDSNYIDDFVSKYDDNDVQKKYGIYWVFKNLIKKHLLNI